MSPSAPLNVGAAPFPGYRLVRQLGQGGWGEVWQAQAPVGTDVALKFLACDSDLGAAQEIRALQSIRQLNHPHLTRIDQIWCWSGYIVIAMELAEGSMIDLFEQYYADFGTCIVPEHLCHYLMQAAEALDFLNDRRHMVNGQRVAIRHCDVKPSNLLVFPGKVKLADFSLAVIATSPMWYQRRVGTLNYAAPEIFQGWLSDRTDLYALAISYIELRTGKLPFTDTPPQFNKTYIRPQPDLSMVTPAERPILRRALAPVPQDRWKSCREMVDRLSQATARAKVSCV
jgi:serine/threonine protein kinase